MKNYAGRSDIDGEVQAELEGAGVKLLTMPECLRDSAGEVKTIIKGGMLGWTFDRAWRYWVVKGPGIPIEYAEKLQETHGKVVRAAGDCACRGPLFWNKGFPTTMYHVDTEEGLKALVDTIKEVFAASVPATLKSELEEAIRQFDRFQRKNFPDYTDSQLGRMYEAIASDAHQRLEIRFETLEFAPEGTKSLSQYKALISARNDFGIIKIGDTKNDPIGGSKQVGLYEERAKLALKYLKEALKE